ncbi:MAG: hypothetical protein LAT50_16760, partial [Ectothiorhodospiraceae bacterium]|nr:hypothetical protein [Ectothiorhodospiraceae bacterium]
MDFADEAFALLPDPVFLTLGFYALFVVVWVQVGWIPLLPMIRRLRSDSPIFSEYVDTYLRNRWLFFSLLSHITIPLTGTAIVRGSVLGRAFRKTSPEEAGRLHKNFQTSRWENAYSFFMLLNVQYFIALVAIMTPLKIATFISQ